MPRDGGAPAENRERVGAVASARSLVGGTNGTTHDHSRGWPDHGVDLGTGSWRRAALSSIKKAISYCGLCGAEKSSGNTIQRTPLSKQRNKHVQTTLIESAKMAPRFSPDLAMFYDREKQKGNANRATLAVARKLVAYLMAVDRGQRNFQVVETSNCIAA